MVSNLNIKFSKYILEVPNIIPAWHCSNALNPQWLCRYRKPRHLGRAPSKQNNPDYFVKSHPTQKDISTNIKLYRNYNSLLKSLVCSFQEEIHQKNANTESPLTNNINFVWDEKRHHQKCMAVNDAANEKKLQNRLHRLKEEKEKMHSLNILYHEQLNLDIAKQQEKLKNELDQLKLDASENWLTLENMEEKIAGAVDNPINFNFAISKDGKIVRRTAQIL